MYLTSLYYLSKGKKQEEFKVLSEGLNNNKESKDYYYYLALYYYEKTIKPENILNKDEFLELCKEVGIK